MPDIDPTTKKNGRGRPAKVDKQARELAKNVQVINRKIESGLGRIADNYEDIVQTSIDLALGNGTHEEAVKVGDSIEIVEVQNRPNDKLLIKLMDVGIDMVDRTGEGPESIASQILRNTRERLQKSLTQVNIDNLNINGSNGSLESNPGRSDIEVESRTVS